MYSFGERKVPFSATHGGKLESSIVSFEGSLTGSFSSSISFKILQKELSRTLQHVFPFHSLSCQGTRAERCLTGKTLKSPFAFTFLTVMGEVSISVKLVFSSKRRLSNTSGHSFWQNQLPIMVKLILLESFLRRAIPKNALGDHRHLVLSPIRDLRIDVNFRIIWV